MAKTTVTHITDDLNGDADAKVIEFSYKGLDYTIDLSEKNEAKFDKAMSQFIAVATQVKARSTSSRRSSSSSSKRDFSAIREWAKGQGLEVSERGRIPKHIVEQYDETN